ncbi:hypothetical protein TNCV_2382421 [Trichonephila clavipes]|nr:hypothetical protein TNCV_2382421 [Trichonephila clavipes]
MVKSAVIRYAGINKSVTPHFFCDNHHPHSHNQEKNGREPSLIVSSKELVMGSTLKSTSTEFNSFSETAV